MTIQQKKQYTRKHLLVTVLTALLVLLACKLPTRLVDSFHPPDEKPTETNILQPTVAEQFGNNETETALLPSLYPGQSASSYPPGLYPPSEPSDTAQVEEYPVSSEVPTKMVTPSAENLPYPQQEAGVYPGEEIQSEYPVPSQPTQQADYPAPGTIQSPIQTAYPYPGVDGILPTTSLPGPTFMVPSITSVYQPTIPPHDNLISSSTPVSLPPTATPTATRTPFLTPTPTLTSTPTPTRTPLPAPPWVNVHIQASDPAAVELASGKPRLIEFFAYWSGPSLAMAPIIAGLENEFDGSLAFVYIDIDDPASEALKKQLGFKREPHFFLLNGTGKTIFEWIGYASLFDLRQKIDAVFP